RPILEGATGLATSGARHRALLAEIPASALGEIRDRPLTGRSGPSLLDVALRGLRLLLRRHGETHLQQLLLESRLPARRAATHAQSYSRTPFEPESRAAGFRLRLRGASPTRRGRAASSGSG